MKLLYLGLCLLSPGLYAQQPLPPLGGWRDHLPYHSIRQVQQLGNRIYAITPFSLYSLDLPGMEITRYSKSTGLTEAGIQTTGLDHTTGKLLVSYTSGNIDIIDGNLVKNIPDFKWDNSQPQKGVFHVFSHQGDFYLSTNYGLLVINAGRNEVRSYWQTTPQPSRVNASLFANDKFYVAMEDGIRSGSPATNLADFRSWTRESGLSLTPFQELAVFNNQVYSRSGDSVFRKINNQWTFFYHHAGMIKGPIVSQGRMFLISGSGATSRVTELDANGRVIDILQHPLLKEPQDLVVNGGRTWVADRISSLLVFNNNQPESFTPNSPLSSGRGDLRILNNVIYAASGSLAGGISSFSRGEWKNYRDKLPLLSGIPGIGYLLPNPDGSVYAGTHSNGLIKIQDNQLTVYKENSFISPSQVDPSRYRVAGLAADKQQNTWIINPEAIQPLIVLQSNGAVTKFSLPPGISNMELSKLLIDGNNRKWIITGSGLLVFDHGNTLQDVSDDRWKLFTTVTGNGSLPGMPLSISADRNGFLWVGTTNGAAVIQCGSDPFRSGCEAYRPVLNTGNFSNYLLTGEHVRSIEVDGANQKWMGTDEGAWLLNPEGDELIQRVETSSSPLPGDTVFNIAIEPVTGEVFFATNNGIAAYRAFITAPAGEDFKVEVFPNPVPPNFQGYIGIRGLPDQAIVKITEPAGRLVYQGISNGGQLTWNGKDARGHSISSGVYLVIVKYGQKESQVARLVIIGSKR